MFNYLINSFNRKIARRVTKKYPVRIDTFQIQGFGDVKFANWVNPLVIDRTFDQENLEFFKRFLNEGDVAIDIGTNIGYMTILMSLVTGKNGLVIGFDPNPFVFEVLSENVRLNPDKTNIKVFNYAISDQDEEFYYNSSEASFNNGGISKTKENRHGKYSLSTKVKGINLESFLKSDFPDRLAQLKLIKIDTEGYDKEIIKSIHTLLKNHKPVVISECFGNNTPEEKFEHFDLLKSLGYSLFYFSDFTSKADIIEIKTKEDMLNWKHFDFYATCN